jgi:serine/threonine protein kinase/CHASE1-domain containing sensor protein
MAASPHAKRPGKGPPTRPPRVVAWGLPLFVFVVGVLLSLAVLAGERSREVAERRTEFERRAAQVAMSAQVSFDVPLEVLRSLPALFASSNDVTRGEFRAFVNDALARYPWIYALEWIPRVPGSERAKFEAAAAADGLPGYHFKQDAPKGPPVIAEPRAEYFPIFYMEPPNEVALGLEETALQLRKEALERARDRGTTIVTERLKLVQDDPSVFSVIAFHPVYRLGERPATVAARRESLRGLAAVVFRMRPVVVNALRGIDLDALDVVLLDADAPRERALLYESRPGASSIDAGERVTSEHFTNLAGRRWAIRISDRAGWVQAGDAGRLSLGVGLLSSVLAAAFAYAATALLRLRRQVGAAKQLGQYTLVEKLGEGGMGTVYRGHHALLRRPTAIKLLHPTAQVPGGATALARFEREVQLMSALTHPNTVVVYDYGHTPDGVFYYAMEYIDGITLEELVDADGAQPHERVVHILAQICAALAEAHAIGLVHRDIKPANVMLCNRGTLPDFVKVLDFGLVKELANDQNTKLSQSATLLGTPHYMAPEAILGRGPVDARADIYAVGGVAYFLLTGSLVFSGGTVVEVCAKHLTIPPEPPSERLGRPIPPALEALVLRCLEKDPDKRPESAEALLRELGALDLDGWDPDTARRWWQERGGSVDAHVKAARKGREAQPSGRALEVDPEGRGRASEQATRAI